MFNGLISAFGTLVDFDLVVMRARFTTVTYVKGSGAISTDWVCYFQVFEMIKGAQRARN